MKINEISTRELKEELETFNQEKPKSKMGWGGYMDGYLRKNLDLAKEIVLKDWDMVFCVDGYEGSGKSVLAQQCAKHCDPNFDIERVCFTPEEFVKAINATPEYGAVVYDEAYQGMSSRAAMSEVNRMLMGVLAEIRQKKLFVFIILPCFFELDKYAAVWRSRGLLHVYTKEKFKRGFFSFYNQDKKKTLYVLGKKFFSYSKPSPNFFGRFPKGYTVDEELYRQKKLDALKAREEKHKEDKIPKTEIRLKEYLVRLVAHLREEYKYSKSAIERICGLDRHNISKYTEEIAELHAKKNAFKLPHK